MTRPFVSFAVLFAVAWLASSAAADPATRDDVKWRSLDAAAIARELVGSTVEGRYASGGSFTEELRADLTTLYRDDAVDTPGTFTLEGEAICFAYPVPLETGCFLVWQRSQNCYDLYFAAGQGRVAASLAQRTLGVGWDARFWRTEDETTCPTIGLATLLPQRRG
ncbi:hypothetical protein [Acuticoccus sp.]|uniref:hypothetical protein n=1 Tax=Acuticoccus sp. TaxID=1904378 RepID=UPI003B51BF69